MNIPSSLFPAMPAVAAKPPGRLLRTLLLSSAALTASASAVVVDVPGNLRSSQQNLNTIVGAGNSGRLLGDFWIAHSVIPGSFNVPVDTNGFTLNLDTGGGNRNFDASGPISGSGSIIITNGPYSTNFWDSVYNISGTTANTYTGTTQLRQGYLALNKTVGVDALLGSITVGSAGQTAHMLWKANDQINDLASITVLLPTPSGALTPPERYLNFLDLAGFSDTIGSLTLADNGTKTQVRTGAGGVLTVSNLTVAGTVQWPGTYTSSNTNFVTGTGSVIVTGTGPSVVVDISGPLPDPLDTVIGFGNSGRLVADTTVLDYPGGTFGASVDLNGFNFTINTGGGNDHTYNGAITGPGTLTLVGRADAGIAYPVDVRLGGIHSNTPDNVTITQGRINLSKNSGKDALAGPITVNTGAGNTAHVIWLASNQINDSSTIDSSAAAGYLLLDLAGFSDTIESLNMKSSDLIDTGLGGVLTMTNLTIGGVPQSAGTYTSADGFVDGSGSVVVTGMTTLVDADNSLVSVYPESEIADGSPVTVIVTLKDSSGTVIPYKAVTLTSSRGAADTISAASGLSDAYGVVFFDVSSLVEGTSVFTASVPSDSVIVTQTASLEFLFYPYANISNTLTPFEVGVPANGVRIDAAVPVGKIGRLVGPVLTHWQSDTYFTRTVDLNSYKLTLDNGGGNKMTLNGTITGDGQVEMRGGGVEILNIGGATSNTYTGTTLVSRGPVRLQKSTGNAVAGVVTINGTLSATFPNSGVLLWGANDQVADTSNLTLAAGSLDLAGFADAMGTVALTGDFTIKLNGTTSMPKFADSSAVTWFSGKILTITGWDGSLAGGGTEGIFFGTSNAGLTVDQLAQISFVDPTGLAVGSYPGKILATGEIVPYVAPSGSTFATWAADNAGNQSMEQDFDGDGVPNGIEYFMGETGSTFTANPHIVTTAGVHTVTWPRDPEANVTFMVQVSENLGDWTNVVPPAASIDETDPTKVVFTLPSGTIKFARLVVMLPTP